MSATVQMEHHTDQRFSRPAFTMLAAGGRFFNKPCCLKDTFHEGVATGDAVMVLQFFMKVSHVETSILSPVEIQNRLKFLKRDASGTWPFHAPVKDAVVAVSLVPGFPTFHGPVRNPDDIGSISPVDLS